MVSAAPVPTDIGPAAAEFPYEPRWFDVGGHSVHCVEAGSGPPLVFVHGNPTWSFYYRDLMRGLAGSRRCIAYDHVGMGLSARPAEPQYRYTLDSRVADLAAVLDQLVPQGPLAFVAHDWGGMIALAWAMQHADRVTHLILGNTGGFHLPRGRAFHWQLRFARSPLGGLLLDHADGFARVAAWTCSRRPGRMTADRRRAYLAPYEGASSKRLAVRRFVEDIPLSPSDPAFHTVQKVDEFTHTRHLPLLLLWGRHDFVFDDAFLEEWQRRQPRAKVRVFEDAGHYVFEDEGAACIDEIAAFLRSNPGPIAAR